MRGNVHPNEQDILTECSEKDKRIAELEAALREIAEHEDCSETLGSCDCWQKIARKALKEK